jgi:hypothetical protein
LTSGNFFSAARFKGPYKTLENLDDILICSSGGKLQPITFGPIPLQHLHTVLSMWNYTVKLDEEKSKKCAGLAQKNSHGSI